MSGPSESVILCEGFDDRAFWAEMLERRFHFRDAREGRRRAVDPFGKPVEAGQFAFLSPAGRFVRITPCSGRAGVFDHLAIRLARRVDHPASRILISVDSDAAKVAEVGASVSATLDAVAERVRRADPAFKRLPGDDFSLDDGATVVAAVVWSSDDDSADLPRKQTLERLVCAALQGAYPARAAAVSRWLEERPLPPFPRTDTEDERRLSIEPKEHAHSHFAGWFAEHGCDDFFRAVWRDEAIARELETRLRTSGAWGKISSLNSTP